MTWNYRLVRDKNGVISIHEVYYDDSGNPEGMTKPITIQAFEDEGENEQTILDILEKIKSSIEKYGVMDDPWPDD